MKENNQIILHFYEGETHLGKLILTAQNGDIAIGRAKDNNLIMKKGDISRKHAILRLMEGKELYLMDQDSKFGTFINEKQIEKEKGFAKVEHGDWIRFAGKTKIFVETGEEIKTQDFLEKELNYVGKKAVFLFVPFVMGAFDVDGILSVTEEGKEKIFWNPVKKEKEVSNQEISDEDWEMILEINEELNGKQKTPPKKEEEIPKKKPVKKEPVLLPGDLIPGYRHIKRLGAGAMGAVYLVEERSTKKEVALKVVLPELAGEQFFINQFVREAKLQLQLTHPYIAKTYATGVYKGIPYIIMDHYANGPITGLFSSVFYDPRKYEIGRQILIQILKGLDYLHNAPVKVTLKDGSEETFQGIVHRDLKPDNIFFDTNKEGHIEVKIADFGMSKAFEAAGLTGGTLTGQAGGTPPFMPKEQVLNYKYCKGEVDVWAAVATIYYLLTGKPPKPFYQGANPFDVAVKEKAVPIRKHDPKVPLKFAKIIDKALVDKKLHYKTAQSLIKELEKIKC